MSHSSNAWSTVGSVYSRGYLVGRGVAAGWSERDIKRAIAMRMRRGRMETEADWGLIDGLSDILIMRGEVPAWSWLPGYDAAGDQPLGSRAGAGPVAATRRLRRKHGCIGSGCSTGRRIGFSWLRTRSRAWTTWIGDLIVGRRRR